MCWTIRLRARSTAPRRRGRETRPRPNQVIGCWRKGVVSADLERVGELESSTSLKGVKLLVDEYALHIRSLLLILILLIKIIIDYHKLSMHIKIKIIRNLRI